MVRAVVKETMRKAQRAQTTADLAIEKFGFLLDLWVVENLNFSSFQKVEKSTLVSTAWVS